MSSRMPARSAVIPQHVPRGGVADVDVYRLEDAEDGLNAAWKRWRNFFPSGFIWTPRNGGHWFATRGVDIAPIYADQEKFPSTITIVPREVGGRFPLRPTTVDPPEHRVYRRVVTAAQSSKPVRRARPFIEDLVILEISQLQLKGRCEFITDFAMRCPILIFFHLAALPSERIGEVNEYGAKPFGDGTASTPAMDRFASFLCPHVAARQNTTGDDLPSEPARAEIDGRELTLDESVDPSSTAVLTDGLDTAISIFGFMMASLARHPAIASVLRDAPSIMGSAVNELLRRFPIMTKALLIRHDQDIRGVKLSAGELIVLPPLHGLDEREFKDAMTVDFGQMVSPDPTFGHGVRRCPGAVFAKCESEVVLHEWLLQIPISKSIPTGCPTMQARILGGMTSLWLQRNVDSARARLPG